MMPPPLTRPQLRALADEAEARAGKATPGPWMQHATSRMHPDAGGRCGGDGPTSEVFAATYLHDAAFIAAARTDVPTLAAALRALLNELEAVEGERAEEQRQHVALRAEYESACRQIVESAGERDRLRERVGQATRFDTGADRGAGAPVVIAKETDGWRFYNVMGRDVACSYKARFPDADAAFAALARARRTDGGGK